MSSVYRAATALHAIPGCKIFADQEVKAIEFEGICALNHLVPHRVQAMQDDVLKFATHEAVQTVPPQKMRLTSNQGSIRSNTSARMLFSLVPCQSNKLEDKWQGQVTIKTQHRPASLRRFSEGLNCETHCSLG
eukprot:1143879-Amphidinium_carterae.2